jgi:flavin reductase ActVB
VRRSPQVRGVAVAERTSGPQAAERTEVRMETRDAFHDAMSHLASGVVLVTACVDGRPWGMTVSACCSVCDDPPTLLVSIAERTVLAKAIAATGRFGANILGHEAIELARFGSTTGQAKFLDEVCEVSGRDTAAPVLDGALTHVDCDLVRSVVHGDHALYLGRVRGITVASASDPLLYYRRDYHRLESRP